jgi:hypothetical protein
MRTVTEHELKDKPASEHLKDALRIPAGKREYKFVMNDVLIVNQKCADWAPNGYGSLNSVLHV